ncbi:MAG: peptide chain release factor 1 [Chlamydia sp.]
MKLDINAIKSRLDELEYALSEPGESFDIQKFKKTAQEHAYLQEVLSVYSHVEKGRSSVEANRVLLREPMELEFQEMIYEENDLLQKNIEQLEQKLSALLIPPDENDDKTTIIEMRAGAGGQEAMLFVADCARMYSFYANHMGWKQELLSASPSELGGFKEYIVVFSGKNVWRYLQHESGTHRVQRVPDTEAQGRIHTSTITIAALMEYEDEGAKVEISEQDLRMETTRSSGAGGQHVNKTDSAVRLTHLPTGIVVFCQEERSQHKNRDKALRLLKAKVVELERKKQKSEIDQLRLDQVGTGDRSEKIRTYNFPQSRVTDHRIGLTKHNLGQVMDGDLEEFSRELIALATKDKKTESLFAWMVLSE